MGLSEAIETVSAREARRVLLNLQGLGEPRQPSSPRAVERLVARLGYVQIDSINVVERAHHLILGARLDGYTPAHLTHALESSRALWEHWTHDACAIPTAWYPHWKHRFASYRRRVGRSAWWKQSLGPKPDRVIRRTLARVRREGPLRARDFEAPAERRGDGWWNWHPEKAALEHLWRTGALAIARRERFEKVYDLPERVYPEAHARRRSGSAQLVDWACREAMARLGIATAREVAAFFCAVSPAQASAWCVSAVKRGELVRVVVSAARTANGRGASAKPTPSFALPEWRTLAAEPDPTQVRVLAPFDPVVRDRRRLLRLFGMDYRFEAFTPAAKRVYGYYTMPILSGDRIIGLIDPKFNREEGTLIVRGPWPAGARRVRGVAAEISHLATQIGAARSRLRADCVL